MILRTEDNASPRSHRLLSKKPDARNRTHYCELLIRKISDTPRIMQALANHCSGFPIRTRCEDSTDEKRHNIWSQDMKNSSWKLLSGWLAFWVPEGICRLLGEQRHQQSQLVTNSINYSSRMPAKVSPLVRWCQRCYRVTANFWLDLRPTPYEEAHTWDCKSSQELVARVVHEL